MIARLKPPPQPPSGVMPVTPAPGTSRSHGTGNAHATHGHAGHHAAQAPPQEGLDGLVAEYAKKLRSRDPGERDNARTILVQMALNGKEGAKHALENDLTAAVWDFNLETLVYLARYARREVASAVDTSLEHNMARLEKENHLNTLAYIAAKSTCSIGTRRRAAKILAERERRAENLDYVEKHTDDLEIKAVMRAALTAHKKQ